MRYRQLLIKGHIESVHPHVDADGNSFTQCLIPDDAKGDEAVAAVAKAGIIWDTHDATTKWADVPARYKRKDGVSPGQDWAGHNVTKTVTDIEKERAEVPAEPLLQPK